MDTDQTVIAPFPTSTFFKIWGLSIAAGVIGGALSGSIFGLFLMPWFGYAYGAAAGVAAGAVGGFLLGPLTAWILLTSGSPAHALRRATIGAVLGTCLLAAGGRVLFLSDGGDQASYTLWLIGSFLPVSTTVACGTAFVLRHLLDRATLKQITAGGHGFVTTLAYVCVALAVPLLAWLPLGNGMAGL